MEVTERVAALEVAVGRHDERLENVEAYQAKQNGSLQRIDTKLDRFTWWLVLTLGGVTTSLILLLVNIAAGR